MSEGAVVSLAANGQLGVDAIAAAMAGPQFHAVLMDIQMPVLDGFGTTRVVREQLQLDRLPIIAMTANALSSDRDDCLAAGMNAHVGKPFDLKTLVQTLLDTTGYQAPATAGGSAGPADHPEVARTTDAGAKLTGTAAPSDSLLDVAAALARMGGLTSLYLRSAAEFLQTLPAQLAALDGLADSDSRQSAMQAHTLKGTAALLGAMDLSQLASQLEQQCKAEAPLPERSATLGRLQALAERTQLALQAAIQALQGGAAAATPHAGSAPSLGGPQRAALQAALAPLLAQLEADDLSALETFAAQREALAALPQELLAPLEDALQDLELEQALQACRALAQWLQVQPEQMDS